MLRHHTVVENLERHYGSRSGPRRATNRTAASRTTEAWASLEAPDRSHGSSDPGTPTHLWRDGRGLCRRARSTHHLLIGHHLSNPGKAGIEAPRWLAHLAAALGDLGSLISSVASSWLAGDRFSIITCNAGPQQAMPDPMVQQGRNNDAHPPRTWGRRVRSREKPAAAENCSTASCPRRSLRSQHRQSPSRNRLQDRRGASPCCRCRLTPTLGPVRSRTVVNRIPAVAVKRGDHNLDLKRSLSIDQDWARGPSLRR